jgi:hypothetical protein
VGDGFHLAGVEIQKGGGLVELHFQTVDDVIQASSRGHIFETIILPANNQFLRFPVGSKTRRIREANRPFLQIR